MTSSITQRIWARDASLWTESGEDRWLGWLRIVEDELGHLGDYVDFAQDVRRAGFTDAVVLGMGGSSLGPEVLAETYGHREGFPRLRILDSTDPDEVRAVEAAVKAQGEHAERVAALRDRLVAEVQRVVPDAIANGHPTERLPGNAHLKFPGCAGDSLLMLLDARDIECSTGSACSAGVAQPSHVLMAMGMDEEDALSSLRFSLGHTSTDADVDALATAIGPCVDRARASRNPVVR